MVIFHSYVSLPEGIQLIQASKNEVLMDLNEIQWDFTAVT